MNMPEPTHYTFRVAWSTEDGEHVATVAEFPSLSWLAATPVEALSGLSDLVRNVVTDMVANGESVPEPLSDRAYSGNVGWVNVDQVTYHQLHVGDMYNTQG